MITIKKPVQSLCVLETPSEIHALLNNYPQFGICFYHRKKMLAHASQSLISVLPSKAFLIVTWSA